MSRTLTAYYNYLYRFKIYLIHTKFNLSLFLSNKKVGGIETSPLFQENA